MTYPHELHPSDEQLSAYQDDELDAAAHRRLGAHLAACPRCTARIADFAALSADFALLPPESPGVDLAGVIEGRLTAAPGRPRTTPRAPGWYGLLPLGIGAAASLALGIALGVALPTGGAALHRPVALTVFDPFPPGSLCAGRDACYARGALSSGVMR
ncbi:MAG: zf-HC2 domain-containing protein [Rhodocyclaceae bacterium]|nr:zf-HC2 domain-containing protein [Rhodocyclaceae bacterium]